MNLECQKGQGVDNLDSYNYFVLGCGTSRSRGSVNESVSLK